MTGEDSHLEMDFEDRVSGSYMQDAGDVEDELDAGDDEDEVDV